MKADIPGPELPGQRSFRFSLALTLTLDHALGFLRTLFGLPSPRIRLVISSAVDTSLLSSLCCVHIPHLRQKMHCQLMEAWQGIKRIKYIVSGGKLIEE